MQDHYCKLHKKFQNRWILIAPPYQNRTFCECCKFQLDKGEELFITIEEFQEKYINPLKDRIKDQKQSENVDKLCKIFKTLLCEIEKILIQMNNIKINFEEIFEDIKKQQQEFENIINNHSFENPHQFSLKEIIQLKNSNKLNDLQDQKFSYFKSFNEVVNQLENIITGFKIQIDQQDQIVSKNFQEYKDQKKDEFKWVGKKKYIGQFWNKNIEIYQKFHFNLEFCLNNEIIYEEFDGTTLRQEQIYDITKQPIILVNNEQIKNFQWVGEYEKVQKVGKWKAYWNGQIIPQIEGYYFEGMKNGFWKECSKNYCSQVNCFEQGFYCNEKRKGIWRYLYEDIEIGGGLYNDSNQKHGIWTELSDHFCSKVQIIYNGKFQNDNKTGIWVILFRDMINQPFKQMYDVNLIIYYCIFWNNPLVEADYIKFVLIKINNKTEMGQIIKSKGFKEFSYYSISPNMDQELKSSSKIYNDSSYPVYEKVGSIKIGKWVDLWDQFRQTAQVTYSGEYNMKGIKVGHWDIKLEGKKIGGGQYGEFEVQTKIGKWVELQEEFERQVYVTCNGKYNQKGMKVGRWDVFQKIEQNIFKWNGYYNYVDQQGSDQKFILTKSDIFYNGQLSNSKKVGRWNIIFKTQKIGGGQYNKEGFEQGRWVELWERFEKRLQIIYNGEYDMKGVKIGRWDIMENKNDKQKQIGGGSYDKEGIKIGKWIELWERFDESLQITYHGEYDMKGIKIDRWDIMENKNGKQKQIGGGSYDKEGIKIGKWIELQEWFKNEAQITFSGVYNLKGMKVGRWAFILRNQQIAGGQYENEQKKIGRWIELDEKFDIWKKITYEGEYNEIGKKTGRWNIMSDLDDGERNKQIGGGEYDKQGIKIGIWVELDEEFDYSRQVTLNGSYNMKGQKLSLTGIQIDVNIIQVQQQYVSGGGSYDNEGQIKVGKWVELDEKFGDGFQKNKIVWIGDYNLQGMKIGVWVKKDIERNQKCGEIIYIN